MTPTATSLLRQPPCWRWTARHPLSPSIEDIAEHLKIRAADAPPESWIRGTGYNEFHLRENRHPTRWDLDAAVHDRPVRLTHRSGHAVVLNSRALALAGIHRDTPDPAYGVIERDTTTGEPTGLLFEMDEYLEGVVPPLSQEDIYAGIRRFNEQCLTLGITSLQDATPGNSVERWRLFQEIKEQGLLTPSMTLMAGASHLTRFLEEGFAFGQSGPGMRLGAAKVVLTMTTGSLNPSREKLHTIVGDAHRSGFQVAIHAIEMEAVEEAIEAIRLQTQESGTGRRHRIEHCSECPPHLIERLSGCGITVVTQPSFIYYSGERYLAEVAGDRLPWLYPHRLSERQRRCAGRRLRRPGRSTGPHHWNLRGSDASGRVGRHGASQRGSERGGCLAYVYAWKRLCVL